MKVRRLDMRLQTLKRIIIISIIIISIVISSSSSGSRCSTTIVIVFINFVFYSANFLSIFI